MANTKAIVTLAVGEPYLSCWKRFCAPNWNLYANKFGYDVICLDQHLDQSKRARERSISWQKCLILRQPFAEKYDRILWLDSDILINHRAAPDIAHGVPPGKIAAAEDIAFSKEDPATARQLLDLIFAHWPNSITNYTAEEYYTSYGLPPGVHRVLNAGVMLVSPEHRPLLEKVYDCYEEKGGREWHMEMRPLSYELVKAGVVHWVDSRFNLMWAPQQFLHYPFLIDPPADKSIVSRAARKLRKRLHRDSWQETRNACLNSVFRASFFLHLGGVNTEDMSAVKTEWPLTKNSESPPPEAVCIRSLSYGGVSDA